MPPIRYLLVDGIFRNNSWTTAQRAAFVSLQDALTFIKALGHEYTANTSAPNYLFFDESTRSLSLELRDGGEKVSMYNLVPLAQKLTSMLKGEEE